MEELRSLVIEGADQYRAYAHPLRRQIMELAAMEPVTAKSLAESMSVSTTRLYRHIDALCQAGLLEVVKEVPKRGVVERWFQAVRRDNDYAELRTGPAGMSRLGAAQVQIKIPPEEVVEFLQRLVDITAPYQVEDKGAMVLTISLDQPE